MNMLMMETAYDSDRCFSLLETPALSLPPFNLFQFRFLELTILLSCFVVGILVICQRFFL